jgi:hypothetical protein
MMSMYGRARLAIGIALAICAAPPATAQQRKPLACQVEASSGLEWGSSSWSTVRFDENRFTLVLQGATLTLESAAKALMAVGADITCVPANKGRISCIDGFGGYLFFDPAKLRGGVAQLSGAVSDSLGRRDTLSVETFTCEPF